MPFTFLLLLALPITFAAQRQAMEEEKLTVTAVDIHATSVHLIDSGKKITVSFGDQLFTRYDYTSHKKPIFYPLLGPQQVPLTRNYPMQKVSGEADDHPHHKSMWLGHEINGTDFWSEKQGSVKLKKLTLRHDKAMFQAAHRWIRDRSGETVVDDRITVKFGSQKNMRWIDYTVEFEATHGDVTFEDTKEGFFALRLHPQLRLIPDKKRGVESVTGQAINDRGVSGKAVWGQPARWVSYSGIVEGQNCGVAVFDHPSNLRHPTTWHAREYGLFAANPFGLHHFQKQERGAGAFTIPAGKKRTFRYRVVLHTGQAKDQAFDEWFDAFAQK